VLNSQKRAAAKFDVDFTFEVGSLEKHNVVVHWRQWRSELTVDVDGVSVVQDRPLLQLKLLKRHVFSVGDSEQHSIEIEQRRKLSNPTFREETFRVLVDGNVMSPTLIGEGE
jgi:hypothetical protein